MTIIGQSDDHYVLQDLDEKYIYESPDGGKTIYRRKFGETSRLMIKKQLGEHFPPMSSIVLKSKTNESLKKALDNLILIYYTVKDE